MGFRFVRLGHKSTMLYEPGGAGFQFSRAAAEEEILLRIGVWYRLSTNPRPNGTIALAARSRSTWRNGTWFILTTNLRVQGNRLVAVADGRQPTRNDPPSVAIYWISAPDEHSRKVMLPR